MKLFFEYAETQLSGGRASVASELFESLWDAMVEPSPLPQWNRGRSGDVDMGIKSLVAQWILARRANDEQTASERLAEIGLVACTPSASQRLTIAQYLGTHNEQEFASEIFAKLLPMVAYGNRDGTSHYSVANAYAFLIEKDDPNQAAAVFSSAVSLGIDSAVFFERAYISLALLMNRWRIEGAVQRNDADQLSREFERMLNLNPLEINIPEKTFPKLKSEPLKSLAERTLNEILNRGEVAMQEMPFYATLHNNLAWIAAINATSLDKAIGWSQRAVQLEPDSVVYRDTLAEVLYRSGKVELALQVERACLHDEPGEWHLHEQIKRFETGAP